MPKNPYLILGISDSATQAEIDSAYRQLVDRYSRERFLEGEAGAEASRKLDEVYKAYDEVMLRAKQASYISDGNDIYYEVDANIKADRLEEAQNGLDNITVRTAKWHYLQAKIYYKRGWLVECKKQLEVAIEMEPDNSKYKSDFDKLIKEMNPEHVFGDGRTARPEGRSYSDGNGTGDAMCDACSTCLCLNCLCNCCWN